MSNAPTTGYFFISVLSLIAVLAPVFVFLLSRWKRMPLWTRMLWVNVLLIPLYLALYSLGRMMGEGISVGIWSLFMLVLRFYTFELFFIPIAFGMLPIMGLAWIASIVIAYMVTKFHSKD